MHKIYLTTVDLSNKLLDTPIIIKEILATLDYSALGVLTILILLDTLLGIAASLKLNIGIDSGIGRHGLISKAVEVLVCITFNILGVISPEMIPTLLTTGIYSFFILFELASIVENLGLMGYEIPVLSRYLKVLKEKNDNTIIEPNLTNKEIYKHNKQGGNENE